MPTATWNILCIISSKMAGIKENMLWSPVILRLQDTFRLLLLLTQHKVKSFFFPVALENLFMPRFFCVFLVAPNRHYQTSITAEFPGKDMRPWSKMGVFKRSAFAGMTPFKTVLLLYLTDQRTVILYSFFTDFQIHIFKQTNSRRAWKIET